MTLRDWLKQFDCGYLHCEIWIDEEDGIAYAGSVFDIPWSFTEMTLADEITYCDRFKDYDGPGLIISLK